MQSVLPTYLTRTDIGTPLSTAGVNVLNIDYTKAMSALESELEGDYVSNVEDEAGQIFKVSSIQAIEGIPYQFMESVDRRYTSSGIGRKYGQKIITQMPLMFMMPCRPNFMPNQNTDNKGSVLQILSSGDSGATDLINGLLLKGGSYYTAGFAYDEYYKCLNTMLSAVAHYMGIEMRKIDLGSGRKYIYQMDWSNVDRTGDGYRSFLSANEAIGFYCDGLSSIDTSFGNTTTQSQLASTINSYSDMANEISFLLNEESVAGMAIAGVEDVSSIVTDAVGSLLGGLGGGVVGNLTSNGVDTVINGGKIVFPEIWSDSTHDESYSFTLKLRSPDNDDLSIFLNIIKPYCELLCFTLPQMMINDPNGYQSPFLVKAYCKGLFHIDMGIIDSMSVTRGAECQWNDNGLPTQIDLQFSITNLYHHLAMSGAESNAQDKITSLFTNTQYMDFLANIAGCSAMEESYVQNQIQNKLYAVGTDALRVPRGVWNSITTKGSNLLGSLYGRL